MWLVRGSLYNVGQGSDEWGPGCSLTDPLLSTGQGVRPGCAPPPPSLCHSCESGSGNTIRERSFPLALGNQHKPLVHWFSESGEWNPEMIERPLLNVFQFKSFCQSDIKTVTASIKCYHSRVLWLWLQTLQVSKSLGVKQLLWGNPRKPFSWLPANQQSIV